MSRSSSIRAAPFAVLMRRNPLAAFNLEFYTEVQDLDRLEPLLDADPRTKKFSQLNRVICELVEDFSLVSFETLCVEVCETLCSFS